LAEYIVDHQKFTTFDYAKITQGEDMSKEQVESYVSELVRSSNSEEIDSPISRIEMVGSSKTISLSEIITDGKKKYKYMKVSLIALKFVPLTTFHGRFQDCSFSMIDNRLQSGKEVRRVSFNSNVQSRVWMGMDYYISTKDIEKIKFVLSIGGLMVSEDSAWAAVKVCAKFKFTNDPEQSRLIPTMVISDLPSDALEAPGRNKNIVDGRIQDNDLKALRQMKIDGDVIDVSQPTKSTPIAVTYAGTRFVAGEGSNAGMEDDGSFPAMSARSVSPEPKKGKGKRVAWKSPVPSVAPSVSESLKELIDSGDLKGALNILNAIQEEEDSSVERPSPIQEELSPLGIIYQAIGYLSDTGAKSVKFSDEPDLYFFLKNNLEAAKTVLYYTTQAPTFIKLDKFDGCEEGSLNLLRVKISDVEFY
jgi:hypothetical protein